MPCWSSARRWRSWFSINSQRPCFEMFVTSIAEVRFRRLPPRELVMQLEERLLWPSMVVTDLTLAELDRRVVRDALLCLGCDSIDVGIIDDSASDDGVRESKPASSRTRGEGR